MAGRKTTWADLMSDESDEDEFLPLASVIGPAMTTEETYTGSAHPDAESSRAGLNQTLKGLSTGAAGPELATPLKSKRSFEARTQDKAPAPASWASMPSKLPRGAPSKAGKWSALFEEPSSTPPPQSPLRLAKQAVAQRSAKLEVGGHTTSPFGEWKVAMTEFPVEEAEKGSLAGRRGPGGEESSPRKLWDEFDAQWAPQEKDAARNASREAEEKEAVKRTEPTGQVERVVLRPRPDLATRAAAGAAPAGASAVLRAAPVAPPVAAPELTDEDWEHRAAQRQKQVDIGKETEGYTNYKKLFPVKRFNDPPSPCSKGRTARKNFALELKTWRVFLHQFDTEELPSKSAAAISNEASRNPDA